METVFGLAAMAALIGLVLHLTGRRARRSRRFKCHDCLHRRRSFDDGVLCGFGSREVFKTRAHIAMCPDWTPEGRRP